MAEIGLVATLITVAGAGGKLALGFYDLSSSLSAARKEIAAVATDISTLSSVLSTLSCFVDDIPETAPSSFQDAFSLVERMVIQCQEELDYMQRLLNGLCQLRQTDGSVTVTARQRVLWLFRKTKLRYHRTSVDALKSNLMLLLASLQHIRAARQNAPPEILQSLGDTVSCQSSSASQDVSDFAQSFSDRALPPETSALGNAEVDENTQLAIEVSSHSSKADTASEIPEDEFWTVAPQVTEHLMVQKGVQLFAKKAVQESSEDRNSWSWRSSNADVLNGRSAASDESTHHNKSVPDSRRSINSDRNGSSTTRERSHDPKMASDADKTPAKASERPQRPQASKYTEEDAEADIQKKLEELQSENDKLRPASDDMKPPIKFKDAVGRKFSFPYKLCKTWKGMNSLITQAFANVEGYAGRVGAGHFDLLGPDGEIILPQVWEQVIQPDWAITMQMWPDDIEVAEEGHALVHRSGRRSKLKFWK